MYGPAYALGPTSPLDIPDPRSNDWVVDEAVETGGLFVDFGCGRGELLELVRSRGGATLGVELDPGIVADTRARTGLEVITVADSAGRRHTASAVHLGDVVEHLVDPVEQLAPALALLRPGGVLLAQGPLEANRSLFTLALRVTGWLRRRRPTAAPPYHVLLATERGQRALFERLGLDTEHWEVREEAWPAPSRLHRSDLRRPRAVGLFVVRKASQLVTRVVPGRRWGNRYSYRGRWPGDAVSR